MKQKQFGRVADQYLGQNFTEGKLKTFVIGYFLEKVKMDLNLREINSFNCMVFINSVRLLGPGDYTGIYIVACQAIHGYSCFDVLPRVRMLVVGDNFYSLAKAVYSLARRRSAKCLSV